jgi:hypothetical protein
LALIALADDVRARLFAAETLVGMGKLSLPGFDFQVANSLARDALAAIRGRVLGNAIFTARRSL